MHPELGNTPGPIIEMCQCFLFVYIVTKFKTLQNRIFRLFIFLLAFILCKHHGQQYSVFDLRLCFFFDAYFSKKAMSLNKCS